MGRCPNEGRNSGPWEPVREFLKPSLRRTRESIPYAKFGMPAFAGNTAKVGAWELAIVGHLPYRPIFGIPLTVLGSAFQGWMKGLAVHGSFQRVQVCRLSLSAP